MDGEGRMEERRGSNPNIALTSILLKLGHRVLYIQRLVFAGMVANCHHSLHFLRMP